MSNSGERWIDRFRAKVRHVAINIVEKRWYRWAMLVALLLFFARLVDPTANSVSPSFLARVPDWIFILYVVLFYPMFVAVASIQKESNLKQYNPDAPEIQQMIRKWRRISWAAAAVMVLTIIFAVIFLAEATASALTWLVVAVIVISVLVSAISLYRAEAMKTGMWSPPEWMPPMNNVKSEEGSMEEEEQN